MGKEFETPQRWWIEVEPFLNVPGEIHHTMVKFDVLGQFFTKFACSCGAQSDDLPSFRPENRCVVCGADTQFIRVELDENWICLNHEEEYDAWREMNRELPPMDFLRDKVQS